MTRLFSKKQLGLGMACTLALGMLSATAAAQTAVPIVPPPDGARDRMYVADSRADVVTSGFGLCWHSGFGPPPDPSGKCEPKFVAYVAPPVMKSVPVPAPAMAPEPVAAAPEPPRAEPPKVYEPPQRPARRDRN
jgi:OOP family OmpA-OmpF porin